MKAALTYCLPVVVPLLLLAACSGGADDSVGSGPATSTGGTGASGLGGASAGGGAAAGGGGATGSGGAAAAGASAGGGANGGLGGAATGGSAAAGAGGSAGGAGDGGAGGIADGSVVDVTIFVANDCAVTTTPSSITVAAGTGFTVNWINHGASASSADVDKIDAYNQVPIIIGLEPGTSYHDSIREWCGQIYSGSFAFRLTGCYQPSYLDVDCGG